MLGGLFVETVEDLLRSQNQSFDFSFRFTRYLRGGFLLFAYFLAPRFHMAHNFILHLQEGQRNQQASEFFAVDIILHNLAANRVDLLPNHLRGDPCGSCDNHFGARSRTRFLPTFRPLSSLEDRAAGTRSAHDGARSRHTGTPRPDRRSRLGRGPVARSVLSSPLSSRARQSLPLRRRSTPSARRRPATGRLRRGSPRR